MVAIVARLGLSFRCVLVFLLVNVGFCADEKTKPTEAPKDSGSSDSGSSDSDSGPKLPGDAHYWTKLLGLGFSEGTLKPSFAPDTLKYSLFIKSGKSKELLVTPMIDTHKYELLYKPKLFWEGVDMKYSPIENIEFKLPLNASGPGPLSKTVTLSVKDPKDDGGFLFHGGPAHDYTIDITQAPDIEEIVTATAIKVVGQGADGTEYSTPNIYNPKSPKNEIRYVVSAKVKTVGVTVTCPGEATSLKYNGQTTPQGSVYQSGTFEGSTKSILGQCIYKDKKWTHNEEMQRTYVITIARNSTLEGTEVDLRMWPPSQQGKQGCHKLDVTTPKSKYFGWAPGWECMKGPPTAQFVGSFDNPHAELVVIANKSGGRYRLWNGIPTQIPTTVDKFDDSLVLEAGLHQKKFTFLFHPPPQCKTYKYPTNDKFVGAKWKEDQRWTNTSWKCPEYMEVKNPEDYCGWKPCAPDPDDQVCCHRVQQLCAKYDATKYGEMECPKGLVFHPENRCDFTPCNNSKINVRRCCAPEVKGSNAACSTMMCPADQVLVDDAAQITCLNKVCGKSDTDVCCQSRAICNSMKCPESFSQKYNSALYLCKGAKCNVLDRDTCCDAAAYCSDFTCPIQGVGTQLGWEKKLNAENIPCGGAPCVEWDTGICCNRLGFCGTLTCPVGYYSREGAEHIPCEGGGTQACTQANDLSTCCEPAASCFESYVCTQGYDHKVGSKLIHCPGPVCEPKDRSLCCDMVNPFQAAVSTQVLGGEDQGSCKELESSTSFKCKATGRYMDLSVEYKFDEPVGNVVYMGEHKITGKTAVVKIPKFEVTNKLKMLNINVASLVAGRGKVVHRLQIWASDPELADITTTKEQTTTEKPSTTKKPSNETKSSSDKNASSSSDKNASSSSDKDASSSSDDDKTTTEEPSGTEEHALRERRLAEADSSSVPLSNSILTTVKSFIWM